MSRIFLTNDGFFTVTVFAEYSENAAVRASASRALKNTRYFGFSPVVSFLTAIDAVFPRYFIEIFDIFVGDFDVGHALILSDKLLHRLPAGRFDRKCASFRKFFIFTVCEIFRYRRFEDTSG